MAKRLTQERRRKAIRAIYEQQQRAKDDPWFILGSLLGGFLKAMVAPPKPTTPALPPSPSVTTIDASFEVIEEPAPPRRRRRQRKRAQP